MSEPVDATHAPTSGDDDQPTPRRRPRGKTWRAPKSGGYTIDDARPEPPIGPTGPAGTSTPKDNT